MIVVIDGPGGAGKSTVARRVAADLDAGYLDTGAMYRALTHLALERDVDPGDGEALEALLAGDPIAIVPQPGGAPDRVLVDGDDVTDAIRHPRVSAAVSAVSAHAGVRRRMVDAQRRLAAGGDWVADGRDLGSVVWPDAEVKVFLTADAEVRAARRHEELRVRGLPDTMEQVLADVRRRDHLDSTRAVGPLRVAEGARVIDSSGLGIDQVVAAVVAMAREAGA